MGPWAKGQAGYLKISTPQARLVSPDGDQVLSLQTEGGSQRVRLDTKYRTPCTRGGRPPGYGPLGRVGHPRPVWASEERQRWARHAEAGAEI